MVVPAATWKPPTPITTRNARFSVRLATGTTGAEALATPSPALHASFATPTTASVSRSVAPEARMVRTAPIDRSTSAVSRPDGVLLPPARGADAPREAADHEDREQDDEHGQPEQHGVEEAASRSARR